MGLHRSRRHPLRVRLRFIHRNLAFLKHPQASQLVQWQQHRELHRYARIRSLIHSTAVIELPLGLPCQLDWTWPALYRVYVADERLQWYDGAELDKTCVCWWSGSVQETFTTGTPGGTVKIAFECAGDARRAKVNAGVVIDNVKWTCILA